MARVLKRGDRRAAGLLCLGLFHTLSSGVVHPLRMLTHTQVQQTSCWQGLSDGEMNLVIKLVAQLDEIAETLRKLGWRCLK